MGMEHVQGLGTTYLYPANTGGLLGQREFLFERTKFGFVQDTSLENGRKVFDV